MESTPLLADIGIALPKSSLHAIERDFRLSAFASECEPSFLAQELLKVGNCPNKNDFPQLHEWYRTAANKLVARLESLPGEREQVDLESSLGKLRFELPCEPEGSIELRSSGAQAASSSEKWAGLGLNLEVLPGSIGSFSVKPCQGLLRVGWVAPGAKLGELGSDGASFGYGGTGKKAFQKKFVDFGGPFSVDDIIMATVDRRSDALHISFAKNGIDLGIAWSFSADTVPEALRSTPLRAAVCGSKCFVADVAEVCKQAQENPKSEAPLKQPLHGREYSARLVAHFLPKFDNKDESEKISQDIRSDQILVVTKKHSGSLVMAPPFYAKNSTANEFSRMGELSLRTHFEAVWSEEAEEKWHGWWADAEERGLCYSFECVVPEVLGIHGATPRAAYMVLTCISDTTCINKFLTPPEVLRLATKWRLPLNEAWFFPGGCTAVEAESLLHSIRWTCDDPMATSSLDGLMEKSGAFSHSFLNHTDTQGLILEGFVMLLLESTSIEIDLLSELRVLVDAYQATMMPHKDSALRAAIALADQCSREGPMVIESLKMCSPSRAFEPLPLKLPRGSTAFPIMGATSPEIWLFVCSGDGKIPQFFRTLLALYAHKVNLKMYRYRDSMQVQIQVLDDDVFYGWKLHCCRGLIPLFRGMVVQYDPIESDCFAQRAPDMRKLPSQSSREINLDYLVHVGIAPASLLCEWSSKTGVECVKASTRDETKAKARIVEVAKLKCLNYIVRTFAIRKHVSSLLKEGNTELYLRRSVPTFFRNWSVPEAHCPRLLSMLKEWANYVTLLGVQEKEKLQQNYLKFLEPFLDKHEKREKGALSCNGMEDKSDGQCVMKLRDYFILILDFTGSEQLPKYVQDALESVGSTKLGPSSPLVRTGFVLFDKPPKTSLLRSEEPTLVIVLAQEVGAGATSRKMYQATKRTLEKMPEIPVMEVQSEVEWLTQLKALPVAPVKESQARLVLAVVGLPPGGGKSTFFQTASNVLGECCQVVSSDIEKGAFDDVIVGALKKSKIVCYDKNIPNAEGIAKMGKVLSKLLRDFDIKVVFVVPDTLGDAERGKCWERVKSRSVDHPALTTHIEGGEAKALDIFTNVFFNACAAFVPKLHQTGSTISTNSFWNGEDAVQRFVADQEWAKFPEVPVPGAMDLLDMPFIDSSHKPGFKWASIEIFGTSLHVTLVPPVFDPKDKESNQRRNIVLDGLRRFCDKPIRVSLIAYHQALKVCGADVERIACWEVGEVDLPDEAHLAEQRNIYHVTDLAALSYGRKPKAAAELMSVLHRAQGDESELRRELSDGTWNLRSWPLDTGGFSVDGEVKIHE